MLETKQVYRERFDLGISIDKYEKQRAIKKIETDNQELHGKIESVLSAGYLFQEKVIIPEKVSVYVTNKND